jgi:hypothetical protein
MKPKKKKIIVIVNDGQVQEVLRVPRGVEVEIRDYDSPKVAEFDDNDRPFQGDLVFKKDRQGDWYEVVTL